MTANGIASYVTAEWNKLCDYYNGLSYVTANGISYVTDEWYMLCDC